jgi:chemotaxis protein histidine kinase CheA
MHILEHGHQTFHETVREVVAAKAKGDDAHSNEMFVQVAPLSQKVIDLLFTIEKAATQLQNVNIVVLQAEGQAFGLVVDDILDTEEIVVKPLGRQLKGISVTRVQPSWETAGSP